MSYDYIVVGGGIAGLYANYLLSKKYNGILLEREKILGGRAFEMNFHKTMIKPGAGIMEHHNKKLLRLLKSLKITPNEFISKMDILDRYDINKDVKMIKEKYKTLNRDDYIDLTMEQFLVKYFGNKFTKNFIKYCEYNDWLKSDVDYFMKYYKIDDMKVSNIKILIIEWNDLVKKLTLPNCKVNNEVVEINKINDMYEVKTKGKTYKCKELIMAVTLEPLDSMMRNILDWKYKQFIGAVPFVRIYAWYKNKYTSELGHYTKVPNELDKIIRINENVLMASYSDNKNAKYWMKISKMTKSKQIEILEKKLKQVGVNGSIDDIVIISWNEGVHYYKPMDITFDKMLKKLSNPIKGVKVVGEMVSKKVGWVEGSIESVERVIKM
jgi:monoamine oxidase